MQPIVQGIRSLSVIASGVGLAVCGLLVASPAAALSVGFDDLVHGEVVTSVDGATITAENFNRGFDIAAAFDTNLRDTRDSDLEIDLGGPDYWSGGNIADVKSERILILQENDVDCGTGICSKPDDEGRRPAGTLTIMLDVPVLDFGLDLIDVDDATAENGMITFFDGSGSFTINMTDLVDPASDFYDATIAFGDNSANRIGPILASDLDLSQIDKVQIKLGGSGGIDNLVGTNVPEPGTALLLGLGLLGLARRRD